MLQLVISCDSHLKKESSDDCASRFVRREVRPLDCNSFYWLQGKGNVVAMSLRLRDGKRSGREVPNVESKQIVRLQQVCGDIESHDYSWALHREKYNAGISFLAFNEKQMQPSKQAHASSVLFSRHKSLPQMDGVIRQLFNGYGSNTKGWHDFGQNKQRRELRAIKLPLGRLFHAVEKQAPRNSLAQITWGGL